MYFKALRKSYPKQIMYWLKCGFDNQDFKSLLNIITIFFIHHEQFQQEHKYIVLSDKLPCEPIIEINKLYMYTNMCYTLIHKSLLYALELLIFS